ncbi:MAG: hypothetical protein HOQ07_11010 [Sinomonas sp.]|nr:hypothetical protein [Sinomonas sp.]
MSNDRKQDAIADLLAEAGFAHDDALGRALDSLRTLCPSEAPEPTGPLADLIAGGRRGASAPVVSITASRAASRAADEALGKIATSAELAVVRPIYWKRHRGAMISAAVVAGVGLSASGVAALGGVDYSADAPQADVRAASGPAAALTPADTTVVGPESAPAAPAAPVHEAPAVAELAPVAEPRHRAEWQTPAERPVEHQAENAFPAQEIVVANAVRGTAAKHVAEAEDTDEWAGDVEARATQAVSTVTAKQGRRAAGVPRAEEVVLAAVGPAAKHLEVPQPQLSLPQAPSLPVGPRHLKVGHIGAGL